MGVRENEGSGNAYNGKGADTYIIIGKNVKLLEVNPKTGKGSEVMDDKTLSLADELIHSLKAMDGKQRKPNWIKKSTYKDVNGIQQEEIQRREE